MAFTLCVYVWCSEACGQSLLSLVSLSVSRKYQLAIRPRHKAVVFARVQHVYGSIVPTRNGINALLGGFGVVDDMMDLDILGQTGGLGVVSGIDE